jgi:hypothetical protein
MLRARQCWLTTSSLSLVWIHGKHCQGFVCRLGRRFFTFYPLGKSLNGLQVRKKAMSVSQSGEVYRLEERSFRSWYFHPH